jgi:AAA+ superfamily predicted ATPase
MYNPLNPIGLPQAAMYRGAAANNLGFVDSENSDEKAAKRLLSKIRKWSSVDGINFMPVPDVYDRLPPGAYDIVVSQAGAIKFSKSEVRTDELIRFPVSSSEIVIDEITRFWELKERFTKLDLPYKRGILLDGPPGSGKTCTVRWIVADVIKRNGIVLNFNTNPIVFISGMKILRSSQPETPIVVVMEDLDAILSQQGNSEILNMLDGFGDVDNTIFLATTNYPEKIEQRVINRPSRFDRRMTIDNPNAECRKLFLQSRFDKIEDEKLDLPKIDVWIKETDNLSFAHIQELFISVVVFENSFEETIKRLKTMKDIPDSTSYGKKQGGFLTPRGMDCSDHIPF